MLRRATPLVVAVLAITLGASAASAGLRTPQVQVNGTSLQNYLNSVGESINVTTDQIDALSWNSVDFGDARFRMMIELGGNAASNSVGVYNAGAVPPSPDLYEVFPDVADAGWFAIVSFDPGGTMIVNLFDTMATLQSTTTYLGVTWLLGFYLQGPGGLFYTQDYRNGGGLPQALAFEGTGVNAGARWLAFEDQDRSISSESDFDDAVLFLEAFEPAALAGGTTWGGLKARYR